MQLKRLGALASGVSLSVWLTVLGGAAPAAGQVSPLPTPTVITSPLPTPVVVETPGPTAVGVVEFAAGGLP